MRGEKDARVAIGGGAVAARGGWPVAAGSLAALIDMGMTDDALARYFGVDQNEIRRRRRETDTAD